MSSLEAAPKQDLSNERVDERRLLAHFATTTPFASSELGTSPRSTASRIEEGHAVVVRWNDGVLFAELCQARQSSAVATAPNLACA